MVNRYGLVSAVLLLAACSAETSPTATRHGAAASVGSGGTAVGGAAGHGGAGTGGEGNTGGTGGAPVDTPCEDPNGIPVESVAPGLLSQTGLYADIASKTVANTVATYAPTYELWSDGATKERFIYLPDCAIGTANMDHWVFPVGTRVWKEFSVDGVPVETRLIHRHGAGANDWLYAVYQWNDALSEAALVEGGVVDANNTPHDIPSVADCATCHDAVADRLLGFGAIQLSHTGAGLTMSSLSTQGKLTVPAPDGFTIPGAPLTRAALGYLHANCGNCHHDGNLFRTKFDARVSTGALTEQDTGIFTTAVGAPVAKPLGPGVTHRILPGDAMASSVWYRASVRQPFVQMPPLATEVVDVDHLAALATWIDALPP